MNADPESFADIRKVLSAFNHGHATRDLSALDDFMNLFIQEDTVEYIGTGGMYPQRGAWRVGWEAVRVLIRSDWDYWGAIHIDEEKANITVHDHLAWISAPATVITDDETEEFLGDKEETFGEVNSTSPNGRRKKPLRFTAILVKQEDRWLFAQIHLSFSILSLPK